jgi:hypothetical protein
MNLYVVEPGKFDLMVGTSSQDGLQGSFTVGSK